MNIKSKSFEEYVEYIDYMQSMRVIFVDTTKKQSTYFILFINLIVIFLALFSILLFKYLNE